MTPDLTELRRWSAEELMGWYIENIYPDKLLRDNEIYCDSKGLVMLVSDWQPDNPATGQIWMLVEWARALGFCFEIVILSGGPISVDVDIPKDIRQFNAKDNNPCLAILLAAHEAWFGSHTADSLLLNEP